MVQPSASWTRCSSSMLKAVASTRESRGRFSSKVSSWACGTVLSILTSSAKPLAKHCGGSFERAQPHQLGARRSRPVSCDQGLALSRQRRNRSEAASGDRRDYPSLFARLCDGSSRNLRTLRHHDGEL